MHNLPTNNETNIIRNIFNVSTQLNESKKASLRPINELADVTEKEINAIRDPDLRAKVMAQHQETQKVKANTASLEAEAGRLKQETERVASGEPSQEYKNFRDGVPGDKPREGASAFARADYAARQREAEDKTASDVRRAKEAEESKARVKAWQSSPEYQKQVEADRAKAAARKESKAAAEAAKARQDQVGPGGGVGSIPSGPGVPAGNVEMGQGRAAKPDTEGFGSGSPKALIGKIWGGEERSTGAYDNTKEKSWLDLGREAIDFLSGGLISMPGTESARERAINTAGKAATERQKVETSKPEYVEKQTQDWRMLPQLVRTGKMKKEDAHKKLKEWETLHGTNDDIAAARKALDASQEPEAEKPWYDPRGWFGESTENYYYHRLANLFEETRDSLEDISAKRRERQVKVAGLEGQVNPHGFMDLVKGIRNVQAFSGMGGGGMPKERVEKQSENVGERTVAKADQRKALMAIMSASQDHADLKDRFTKEDALNPHSPLHKMLVSRNPDLRDESKVMAKYHTGS